LLPEIALNEGNAHGDAALIGSPEEIEATRRKLGLPPKGMTPRQWEVFQVYQRSPSYGAAARELGIAPKDVAKVVNSKAAQEWRRGVGALETLAFAVRSVVEIGRVLADPTVSNCVKAEAALYISRKREEVGVERPSALGDGDDLRGALRALTSFDLRRVGPAFSRSQRRAIRRVIQGAN
jgi:hypothetical protein